MLSPSDFNNAVPQFANGDYASNPINPQYIAEPDAVDYNRGSEPLQTLPAQWWNWFLNKFTNRFNKVNIYVKNIFNELTQLLSLVSETPSGTEGTPTVGQLKDMFETKYPDYLTTTTALSNTYVPQTTKVNGHALSGNITITCVACAGANGSGTAFGTAATVNTGTAAGCIPTVGTALGTTDGQFLATDSTGKLKPSGYTASSFRASSWTPSLVACACCGKNGNSYSAFGSNAFNSTAFTTCTGTVTQVKVGTTAYNPSSGVISLPAYPSIPTCVACAGKIKRNAYTNAYLFTVALTNGCGTADGTDLYASCNCLLTFCSTTGVLYATCFCGTASEACTAVKACCASCNGSGVAFGSAATKTAGSAAGNVPLVGTALGTTDGQFLATDANGCLKPSGYTASSFLGATATACNSICFGGCRYVDAKADIRNYNPSLAIHACLSCCSECMYARPNAIRIWCCSSSYCLCNRCIYPVVFTPDTPITGCKRTLTEITGYIGAVIPAQAKCCIGAYCNCIGNWDTCYPGVPFTS